MKQNDIRAKVAAGAVAGLVMLLAACANTDPVSEVRQVVPVLAPVQPVVVDDKWNSLSADGLHDPENPGIQMLQEPREVLSELPTSTLSKRDALSGLVANPGGNMVNWVRALVTGAIKPRRAKAAPTTGVEAEELVMDMDIMLNPNGSMPKVRFPHRAHTMWLACSNCHPAIFIPQKGANPISMERILSGEQCGICHGAVAFPPTDCNRCHSVPHVSPILVRQPPGAGGGL